MTIHGINSVICSSCGGESQHFCLRSALCWGGPDLDGRPPEMGRRASLHFACQQCPHCGYVAADLEKGGEHFSEIARSPAWLALPPGNALLLNRFGVVDPREAADVHARNVRAAFLAALTGDVQAELSAWLRASWAADDAEDAVAARAARRRALPLATALIERLAVDDEQRHGRELARLDVMRRAGEPGAAELAAELVMRLPGGYARLAAFQATLIAVGDVGCHAVDEAPRLPRDEPDG